MQQNDAPLFFTAVRWNAAFSALCGTLMAVASGWVAALLGFADRGILVGVGVGLLLFSLRLFLIGRSGSVARAEAWAIIVGDLAWVAFSAVLLLAYAAAFSVLGQVLIAATAFTVLALTAAQFAGVRRAAG